MHCAAILSIQLFKTHFVSTPCHTSVNISKQMLVLQCLSRNCLVHSAELIINDFYYIQSVIFISMHISVYMCVLRCESRYKWLYGPSCPVIFHYISHQAQLSEMYCADGRLCVYVCVCVCVCMCMSVPCHIFILLHRPGCNFGEQQGVPASCAVLGRFALGAQDLLLWQHTCLM